MDKEAIAKNLSRYFPEHQLKTSLTDRYAFAGDAGFYYLIPSAIVLPETEEDIRKLFLFATEHKIPVTFRTAGTSLSGQSITDGILADLSRNWKKILPLQEGNRIKVQPAAIGSHVNKKLLPFAKKIGPDPASISAAMMGGILSNNSSGMCCGVTHNSYHTLASIRFVLPNGHAYDTSHDGDYMRFQAADPDISEGILALQKKIRGNESLVHKIQSKYRIKNTVGYSINAFLDYKHPLDILAHLLIGAEGTLAFISEAVLHTIPDKPFKSTGLLIFENPVTAANAIPLLKSTSPEALELMDRPALHSIERMDHCPALIRALPEKATAILCEYQGVSPEDILEKMEKALPVIATLPLIDQLAFTRDSDQQAILWKLRKGMYPSVAAVRAKGTTAMLEDVAVPIENLGNTVTDLQALFQQYGYSNAIIFGHAKEGNLHFLITQPVNTKEDLSVFEAFNQDLASMIIHKYKGSLKAEHGTGRQIAPFVQEEWGEDAYQVMQQLKQLIDPFGILNPGVIINNDPKCHLKDIKTLPIVEEEVDRCVECGYCENRCPSREYTLTPRQRIQLRRSLKRLEVSGDQETYQQLLKEYRFSGMDTCAVDGMCAVDCPVSINTGDLIKRLRRENHGRFANQIARQVSLHFGFVERLIKLALRSGHWMNRVFGKQTMQQLTIGIRKQIPAFPLWITSLSRPVKIIALTPEEPDLVYFPTCITRMMGADKVQTKSLPEIIQGLCEKAGLKIYIPDSVNGVCCGQLFSSKGFPAAYTQTVNEMMKNLWQWTLQGKLPVLVDVTSCTHSLQTSYSYLSPENKYRYDRLKFIDSIDFAADYLLPKLTILSSKNTIVFHPVCTVYKMNLLPKLQQIGKICAVKAEIPFMSSCCGMAGDRGFYYPGLTQAATRAESAEVKQLANDNSCDGFYSSGKTCEMALQESTQLNYQSIFYLLQDVTEPAIH